MIVTDLSTKPKKGKVRILPVEGWHIVGVPTVPQDVDPDVAAELLAYTPAAFVLAEDEPAPAEPPANTKE